jgi:phage tail tape-measure protein
VKIADKAMGRMLWAPEATAEYQRARSEIKARNPADEAYVGAAGRFVTGRLGTLAGAQMGAASGAALGAVAGPPGMAVGGVVGGVLGGVAGGVISDKAGVNDAGGEAAKRALRAAKAHWEERRHELAGSDVKPTRGWATVGL